MLMNLNEFQQLISITTKPLVIDIWAKWCVPCRVTKPILEKLADEYAESVEFVAINADESPDVIKHLGLLTSCCCSTRTLRFVAV